MLRLIGLKRLPGRSVHLPHPAPSLPKKWDAVQTQRRLVYMPSCLSRSFASHGTAAPQALHKIAAAAGVEIIIPPKSGSLCCGQPFASKGFPDIATQMQQRIVKQLQAIKEEHENILIIDTSTCAAQLEAMRTALPEWQIIHPAAALSDIFIPLLQEKDVLHKTDIKIVLHPTCAERKQGWLGSLEHSVAAVGQALMPNDGGCCGMAGDRGWLEPALTTAATAREGEEVQLMQAEKAGCTNLACGLAMEAAGGQAYEHVWSLIAAQLKEHP
jgi:D-lactate dehydrogenase